MMEPSNHCQEKKDDRKKAEEERQSRLGETRPTPGSAEGERDVRTQSDSNVPERNAKTR